MKKTLSAFLLLAGTVLTLAAGEHGEKKAMPKKKTPTRAVAVLQPTAKFSVRGIIVFTQKDGYVEVSGQVEGLTPGLHGFHVHEFGDQSSSDGLAAGGHFNPDGEPHGAPDAEKRHVGDLGNIKAGEDGIAKVELKDKLLELSGPHSIIGHGLVVHVKADDLKTQPTGDAGGRVAVGVIGIAKTPDMKKK